MILMLLLTIGSTNTVASDIINRAVLDCAKRQINRMNFDLSRSYDRPQGEGVCIDLINDAYLCAGIDLPALVWSDIQQHRERYAYAVGQPIDARRCRVMIEWFFHFTIVLPVDDDFQPGDVVFYTGAERDDGVADHTAIVSDAMLNGIPLVIDNFPWPGYVSETKAVTWLAIVGHFRYPAH